MGDNKQNTRSLISRMNLSIASMQAAIQEAITIRNELEGFYPQAKTKKKRGEVSVEDIARVRAASMRRRKITINKPQ